MHALRKIGRAIARVAGAVLAFILMGAVQKEYIYLGDAPVAVLQ